MPRSSASYEKLARWTPQLRTLTQPRLTPYIPQRPTPKQAAFLLLDCREALYGGAAGGGKSSALLMAALQYADMPAYAALILRRSYADLALPGALMERAHEWLGSTEAVWHEKTKTWSFPSGATLTFGYLQHERDKYRYQSSEFQYIAFDELTQFTETQFTYLFSRLRKGKNSPIPLRMRAASNPGGAGHEWVRQRYLVEGREKGRVFIPAALQDNPYLAREEYLASLQNLDPLTRARLLAGDWEATEAGMIFRREWFPVVDTVPADLRQCRYWDLAASEPSADYPDPDWTAGCRVGISAEGTIYVLDMIRARLRPGGVEALIQKTAAQDGAKVMVGIEQEGGGSGVALAEHYRRRALSGYTVFARRPTGSKRTRWATIAARAEQGDARLLRGAWIGAFLEELERLRGDGSERHDDQADAFEGAYYLLTRRGPAQSARGNIFYT